MSPAPIWRFRAEKLVFIAQAFVLFLSLFGVFGTVEFYSTRYALGSAKVLTHFLSATQALKYRSIKHLISDTVRFRSSMLDEVVSPWVVTMFPIIRLVARCFAIGNEKFHDRRNFDFERVGVRQIRRWTITRK